jgi:enterochelin esterase-like enzyme
MPEIAGADVGRERTRLGTQIQTSAKSILPPSGPPHPRVHRHPGFASRFLAGEREITVYVPPGYGEAHAREYPLLILQDGQNLFDPETSFVRGQTWRVAESADEAIASGEAEPLLIAGIANAGERRLAEYTPSRDWKLGGGEAGRYSRMVISEILPFLRERYSVRRNREAIGVGGSSLGGLVSLWMGLEFSEVFGKLAVLSPSVWWNHRYIVSYVNDRAAELDQRPRIWLDVGDAEGRRTLGDAELLDARLRGHGWREGVDLHFERVRGGTHNEAAWAERVRPMLRYLFPAEGRR